MKSTDLIINVNPKSIFSESIKTIRTNLALNHNLSLVLSCPLEHMLLLG